ncbi:hypothetical protein [Ktedonobacter racemifer]|uniref:Uncharacterized protein n=1 Tax=Ktedonobacter racemifer DSM 44963 TaxID=485913 RepID=D6U888_KTERA|nr:hypothetical protein [Ktedonobacter racemifer]EFH80099.1 hypothetical protein Krac_0650 [Ktedonobacter racemifer DSM 44963]
MASGKFIIAAGGAFGCNERDKSYQQELTATIGYATIIKKTQTTVKYLQPSPLITNSCQNGTVFLTLAMRISTD